MLKPYYISTLILITCMLQGANCHQTAPELDNFPWFPIVESGPANRFICTTKIRLSAYFLTHVQFQQDGQDMYAFFNNRKERLGRCKAPIKNLQPTIIPSENAYIITFAEKNQIKA